MPIHSPSCIAAAHVAPESQHSSLVSNMITRIKMSIEINCRNLCELAILMAYNAIIDSPMVYESLANFGHSSVIYMWERKQTQKGLFLPE
jgi:hypothetical protein